MFDKVKQAEVLLRDAVGNLDPDVLEAAFAKELVAEFAEIERIDV